eukprot:TRINITY_DN7_c0_g1_i2.p1 TRINITY_DN7_c0_g1~~TRINITY_DN7_c0_g1_i2.p1  ORF type:complete len:197 (+),score=44.82 TRINITY_DN7_c0_g1_i2:188-778(+)
MIKSLDRKGGYSVCANCGSVLPERIIDFGAENRVFSEDPDSFKKGRTGDVYNIFMEHSLTEKSKLERDEKEFFYDGMKNISDVFSRLYRGDTSNRPVQDRAKELFQQAFHIQVKQKEGAVPMKRSGKKSQKDSNRLKFSRRKQFVVTAIYRALQEQGISTFSITDISDKLDGINVSEYSVNHCLKDLSFPELKTNE